MLIKYGDTWWNPEQISAIYPDRGSRWDHAASKSVNVPNLTVTLNSGEELIIDLDRPGYEGLSADEFAQKINGALFERAFSLRDPGGG